MWAEHERAVEGSGWVEVEGGHILRQDIGNTALFFRHKLSDQALRNFATSEDDWITAAITQEC